jgi:hypothetical protein
MVAALIAYALGLILVRDAPIPSERIGAQRLGARAKVVQFALAT